LVKIAGSEKDMLQRAIRLVKAPDIFLILVPLSRHLDRVVDHLPRLSRLDIDSDSDGTFHNELVLKGRLAATNLWERHTLGPIEGDQSTNA
jgi:hypothetical protein